MLLDILIPTYKRPERVLSSIRNILSSDSKSFRIICVSNCYEPNLACLYDIDSRVIYNYNEENIGPVANIKNLLAMSTAKYSLYLSDEDTLDPDELKEFLFFLEKLADNVAAVVCSVFESSFARFSVKIPSYLDNRNVDLGFVLTSHVLPHYLSGYVFRRDLINNRLLDKCYTNSQGGVYPMLQLALELIKENKLSFYSRKFVLQGPAKVVIKDDFYNDAAQGVAEDEAEKSKVFFNPFIYSAYGFARQFYLMEKQICELRPFISFADYLFASVNRFLHMLYLHYVCR